MFEINSTARFGISLVVLLALFHRPVLDLVRFALGSDLYSHIVLIPFISLVLAWRLRHTISTRAAASFRLALLPAAIGIMVLATFFALRSPTLRPDDYLALTIFPLVCFVWSSALLTLGSSTVRHLSFPLAFLVFFAPFPTVLTHAIEVFFQHASAEMAHLLFRASGSSMTRQGFSFHFPGLSIRVAEECSGIHSTLVLFITSLLAGHLFLRSRWNRAALVLLVVPLAIVRNATRIFTLVMLTLHVSPNAIHSPIHTRGGPLFFLLSLIPFFLLLAWLRRKETAVSVGKG